MAAETIFKDRAGRFVTQPEGYSAFIPKPLPPDPSLAFDTGMLSLLEEAVNELGRLDGVAKVIPDPDFFVSMYVRREAVLSSQIEGTQSARACSATSPTWLSSPTPGRPRDRCRLASLGRG